MNDKQRNFAIREMANYSDMNIWASDIALSSVWGDAEDEDVDLIHRAGELIRLWNLCHMPARELFAPLTIKQLSDRFCIPYRTVQNWYMGERECVAWIRLLIVDAIDREV